MSLLIEGGFRQIRMRLIVMRNLNKDKNYIWCLMRIYGGDRIKICIGTSFTEKVLRDLTFRKFCINCKSALRPHQGKGGNWEILLSSSSNPGGGLC